MSYDCFISYAAPDLPFAQALCDCLVAAGLPLDRVWFDKARLHDGYNWHEEIEAGCEASRVVVPVLTPRWKRSEWTRYETYGAEAAIPLLYEGTWDEVKTPPLGRWQDSSSAISMRIASSLPFTTCSPNRLWKRPGALPICAFLPIRISSVVRRR